MQTSDLPGRPYHGPQCAVSAWPCLARLWRDWTVGRAMGVPFPVRRWLSTTSAARAEDASVPLACAGRPRGPWRSPSEHCR